MFKIQNTKIDKKNLISNLKEHKITLEELCRTYNLNEPEVLLLFSELKEQTQVEIHTGQDSKERIFIKVPPQKENVYLISEPDNKKRKTSFGVCADIHFASKYHLTKAFHEAMKILEDDGINKVYIAGDVLDGINMYKGHLQYLTTPSAEGQTDIAAESLSQHPNMEFWAIAGDHDTSFTKANGVKPLSILESKIDNFRYLGDFKADIIYHGIKIRLLHTESKITPKTYLKNLFEAYEREEREEMPHIAFIGHHHASVSQENHYDTFTLQPGSFLDGSNELFTRRGLKGPNGLYKVQLSYQNTKINRFAHEYIQSSIQEQEKGSAFFS